MLARSIGTLCCFLSACASTSPRTPLMSPFGEPCLAAPASAAPATAAAVRRDSKEGSYTIGKLGTFIPDGDISDLDDGFAGEVIFGHKLLPILALEGSVGYLAADGNVGATQLDLWAVPLFVNARVSLPVLILEAYGGVGLGGMYVDYEVSGFASENDWVTAWQAFLGLEVGLGGVAVGAEYKYVQSDDTKDNFAVEGSVASLFVSLPF